MVNFKIADSSPVIQFLWSWHFIPFLAMFNTFKARLLSSLAVLSKLITMFLGKENAQSFHVFVLLIYILLL